MIRPLYKLIALCLALAWVPATMCCTMDVADVVTLCSNDGGDCCGSDAETNDTCTAPEDGRYERAVSSVKVSPPVIVLCAGWICAPDIELSAETRQASLLLAEFNRPHDWVPTWQFERRAAAPAHAPDSLNA